MASRPHSETIPNLVNGVSQQPASLRLNSQSEAEVNTYPSIVEGLKKRPPTEHVAKVITGTLGSAYIHTINRDTAERYIVIVTNGGIRVFDLTGTEKTVNFAERTETLQEAAVAIGDGDEYTIYLPSGTTTVDISSTIETTATITWETSADGTFTDAVTLATHTTSTDESKTVTSGHAIRARISAWTSGTVDASVTWEDASYLVDANPDTAFRATTIADYTFIVNKNKTISMDEALSTAGQAGALVSVKQVAASTTYKIFIDGTEEANYATPASGVGISTDNVATELKADLDAALTGYTVTRQASSLLIEKDDGTAFEVKTEDSRAGTYMNVAIDEVQKFADLPVVAPTDFIVEVIGDQSSSFDNYYVKHVPFNDGADFDEGVWEETVKPEIQIGFSLETMPHTLVREADGTFTFGAGAWGQRTVGDEDSAPNPSFVGTKINDVFFYKNRLGFLADENVIMSRAGEFFQFFPETVTTILDSNPIDVAATNASGDSAAVSILHHAVAFDQKLLLFSDQAQFIFEGGDILSPTTASIDPITAYECDTRARPVGSGKNVYFATPNGQWTGLREMFVEADTLVNDAADVTAHAPAYVPSTPIKLAAVANGGLVVALCGGDQDALYPYKFYWSGNKKLQSAWTKWQFDGDTVLDIGFIEQTLYILYQRTDAVYLESLDVQAKLTDPDQSYLDEDARWLTHLDRRVTEADCSSITYSAGTGKTSFTLPYDFKSGATLQVVTRAHTSANDDPGVVLVAEVSAGDDAVIEVEGDYSDANDKLFFGEVYTAEYTFSRQVLKEQTRGGGEAIIGSARIDHKIWSIVYDKTGFFQVEVYHEHRPNPSIYKFTGRIMGAPSNKLGSVSLPSGTYKFPVLAKNDKVTIKITSDSFLPMKLQNAEWSAEIALQYPRRF